jgi:hypothetical protein
MVHNLAEWRADGSPWRAARPLADIGARLTAHGYRVRILGGARDLTTDQPGDHVPWGAGGWPRPQRYPFVMAMDVEPPDPGSGLPSLQALGRQFRVDKLAGHPGVAWLSGLIWEPERDGGGPCWCDSWMPDYDRQPGDDRGHLHLSCRTDHTTAAVAAGYDPVGRLGIHRPPAPRPIPGLVPMGMVSSEPDVSWTDDVIPIKCAIVELTGGWAAGAPYRNRP